MMHDPVGLILEPGPGDSTEGWGEVVVCALSRVVCEAVVSGRSHLLEGILGMEEI